MALNKREQTLLIITVAVAAAAAVYMFIPVQMGRILPSIEGDNRQSARLLLLEQKDDIVRRHGLLFSPAYYKNSPEEQQVHFQEIVEKTARSCGVTEVLTLRPMEPVAAAGARELPLQIDMKCTASALTGFLHRVASLPVAVHVNKMNLSADDADLRMIRGQFVITLLWIDGGGR